MLPRPQLSDAAESARLKRTKSSTDKRQVVLAANTRIGPTQLELVLVDLILLFEAILTLK
jgi:hypothetical protein